MTEPLDPSLAPAGRSIGAILIDRGRLTPEAAERILRRQKEACVRFGDAALQLGLLTEEDIREALSSQFDYPYLTPGQTRVNKNVIAAFQPFSPLVEQLRILRSQLMLRWFTGEAGRRCLAIISPDRQEGRSFITANLAVVLSQLGERTLVIDADLRQPAQHGLFGIENKQGLSTLLAGRGSLAESLVRIPGLRELAVLPAGAVPPNPQELISRPAFQQLLDEAQQNYDVVLIDTPAGALTGDAQTIALRSRGALMLARRNHTLAERVTDLTGALRQAGVQVIGSLLNTP